MRDSFVQITLLVLMALLPAVAAAKSAIVIPGGDKTARKVMMTAGSAAK